MSLSSTLRIVKELTIVTISGTLIIYISVLKGICPSSKITMLINRNLVALAQSLVRK